MEQNTGDYNGYMKKFENDYRMFMGEDRIWNIKAKNGQVYSQSPEDRTLAVHLWNVSGYRKNRLKENTNIKVLAEADSEIIMLLKEDFLPSEARFLGIFQKKRYSDAQRQVMAQRFKKQPKNAIPMGLN